MAWLDLDQVEVLDDLWPWFSSSRPAMARFTRADFLDDPTRSLADEARGLVEAELGFRPDGAVFLLANLRTWGWSFNPITVYYLCDAAGVVSAQVLDVSNTPWHEHHCYVLDRRTAGDDTRFAKSFHVSPFLPMDLTYDATSPTPSERLTFGLAVRDPAGIEVFSAGLDGLRVPFDAAGVRRLLVRTPTHRVSVGIYTRALRLAARGAPFHPHPKKQEKLAERITETHGDED